MTARVLSSCFFCGGSGPGGTSCPSCLVTIPRLAPEVPATYACPRCTTPLLPIGIAPSATIHACSGCHGMFVGARAWCTLVSRPELSRAIVSKLPPRGAPPSELVRLLRCPACPREMERGRFGASSTIVIDVCIDHGMWLDSGEIAAIADHAALRARVGVAAARRATDAAESGGHDALRAAAAAEAESTMRAAAVASRRKNASRAGLLLFLAFVALRVWYFYGRQNAAAPPEISGAGESAKSAATALGHR